MVMIFIIKIVNSGWLTDNNNNFVFNNIILIFDNTYRLNKSNIIIIIIFK